jgi:hypothetical protein
VYWLDFAAEPKPENYDASEIYDCLRRSVLKVACVESGTDLTENHFKIFQNKFTELHELRTSFKKTSGELLRAAKLVMTSSAILSNRMVADARSKLLDELNEPAEAILHPDRITTRLQPRIEKLEKAYITAYVDELFRMVEIQKKLDSKKASAYESNGYLIIADMAIDLPEAHNVLIKLDSFLSETPQPVIQLNQSRKEIDDQVERRYVLSASDHSELPYNKIQTEITIRLKAFEELTSWVENQFDSFAGFLLSLGIQGVLNTIPEKTPGITALQKARAASGVLAALKPLSKGDRAKLAKGLRAAMGNKKSKTIQMKTFIPKASTLFEKADISATVKEFENFLNAEWEDGKYLRIE